METAVSPQRILQTGFGFWASRTLLTAAEFGIFTILAKQPLDAEALRKELGLHPRSARDFFDALVALKFLEREGELYRNSPESAAFLDKNKPAYLGGMLEMCSKRLYGFWNDLGEGLRTGKPQNEGKRGGEDLFAVLYAEPARLKDFLQAMTGLSHPSNVAIARQFSWKDYKTYADVGTAQGDLAVQIAAANPHLRGIGFDLPVVGSIFKEYVEANRLSARLEFQAGDFFSDQPFPKVDVITMGHILHDWNLEQKKTLIRKAYEALPPDGALVLYEAIIDDERRENAFGLLMSLNMLIETPGGFDYSGRDAAGWLKEAGFRQTRVEHLVGPDSMVVGIK